MKTAAAEAVQMDSIQTVYVASWVATQANWEEKGF